MKLSFQKICGLIAASEIKERDILEFAQQMRELEPESFASYVLKVRDFQGRQSLHTLEDSLNSNRLKRGSTTDVSDKIARLLLEEARLSKFMAIDLLAKELAV